MKHRGAGAPVQRRSAALLDRAAPAVYIWMSPIFRTSSPMRRLLFILLSAWAAAAPVARALPDGFEALFNSKDLAGWKVFGGKQESWGTEDGVLFTSGGPAGWLFTEKEYGDFELRLEYKASKNANSGVSLRAPREGDPAFAGMEVQILDDGGSAHKDLKPEQYTGAIYSVVGPSKRVTKPAGEWNALRLVARGRQVTVTVNDTRVVDANLDDYAEHARRVPGLRRAKGHIGLQAHGGQVEFRNIYLKPL